MKTIAYVVALSALVSPAFGQEAGSTTKPVPGASSERRAKDADVAKVAQKIEQQKIELQKIEQAEQKLYKARWLQTVQGNRREALALYKEFLAAAPNHEHAPRAAAYALSLVSRREQDSFRKQHAALLEKVDADVLAESTGRGRGRGGFGRGPGRGPGGDRGGRGAGGGRGFGGGRGAGGRGAAGRGTAGPAGQTTNPLAARMPTRLPDMTKAEREAFLERYGKVAADYVAELRKNNQTENADKLAKMVKEITDLIQADKPAEAQAKIDEMQRSLNTRGRGRR